LKVTLVPGFGGRITSIIHKPTGHEQLYRSQVGVPYGIEAAALDAPLLSHLSRKGRAFVRSIEPKAIAL
jgi:hypothetical protein